MICTLHMSYFYWGQMWVGTPKMKSGYHRTTLNLDMTHDMHGMRPWMVTHESGTICFGLPHSKCT